MVISVGDTLAMLRRSKKLMQKDIAARLSDYGFNVNAKTIYNWEKCVSQPSIQQFIALCDIFEVEDVLWQFARIDKGPYSGLNSAGRLKAREFIDILLMAETFRERREATDTVVGSAAFAGAVGDASEQGAAAQKVTNEKAATEQIAAEFPRLVRLYDIPASAGTGSLTHRAETSSRDQTMEPPPGGPPGTKGSPGWRSQDLT